MKQLDDIRDRAVARARWMNTVSGDWIGGANGECGPKLGAVFRELRASSNDLGSLLLRTKRELVQGDRTTALAEKPTACPDCKVAPGYTHHAGCDVERCSSCGLQRIGCACENHDPKMTFWTGYWPGDEATRLLQCDHNELAVIIGRRREFETMRSGYEGPH